MAMDNSRDLRMGSWFVMEAFCDASTSSCNCIGCMHDVSPLLTCNTSTGDPQLCLVSTIRPELNSAAISHITRLATDVLPYPGCSTGGMHTHTYRAENNVMISVSCAKVLDNYVLLSKLLARIPTLEAVIFKYTALSWLPYSPFILFK